LQNRGRNAPKKEHKIYRTPNKTKQLQTTKKNIRIDFYDLFETEF